MKNSIRYDDHLPLEAECGYARNILIESCKLDDGHYQIRAELTDNRADFVDATREIPVHGMAVRLTLRFDTNEIVRAEFALPRLAFQGMCENLPVGPEALVGLRAVKGFSEKLRELYGRTRSCWHLYACLQAIVPALMQCAVWTGSFRNLDESLAPEQVPTAMGIMTVSARNSCHAWEDGIGGIQRDFAAGNYRPMLNRMAPRLLRRWEAMKAGK